MIENEKQLRYSIESVARLYRLNDCIAAQREGDPDTRADEIEGIESMIRKIEREIAAYLHEKYSAEPSVEKPVKVA